MASSWRGKTYDELADEADAGMRGNGAMVEANRRFARAAKNLTWVIIFLTVVLVILTALMATSWPQF